MSEDTARAVGAFSSDSVLIQGKECFPRALTLKELGELERDCLSRYRKASVQGFAELLEFLPAEERAAAIAQKVDDTSRLQLKDIPPRWVHDPAAIVLTDELRGWLQDNMDGYLPDKADSDKDFDLALKSAAAAALDQDLMSDTVYKELTKHPPRKTRVGYVNWWTTGSFDGRLSMMCLAFREYGFTRDQIAEAVGMKQGILLKIARDVEKLSAPDVGNG